MKRTIPLLCALSMLMVLCACGAKQKTESPDLTAFYTSLTERYGEDFPASAELTGEQLDGSYPGLSDLKLKQQVIYAPMMSAVVCEIALVECENEADAEKAAEIFKARADSQADGGAWYPDSVESWKNDARIVTEGNTVMLIAWSGSDEVVSAFQGLFSEG